MATNNHLVSSILFVAAAVAIAGGGTLPVLGQTPPVQRDSVAGLSVTETTPASVMAGGRIFLDPDRDVFQAKLPWNQDDEDVAENPEEANPSHGFKMHGHWIIDVKNPDGTIAEHREFENALQPTGASYILGLMGGFYAPGNYMVVLYPPGTPNGGYLGVAPCISNGAQAGCAIVSSVTTYPGLAFCPSYLCATGLTSYTTPSSTSAMGVVTPGSLTILGAITANQAGVIGQVVTLYSACAAVNSPIPPTAPATMTGAQCQAYTPPNLLVAVLSSKTTGTMNVGLGQVIQVMVIITFS
jgi:hypothetical protein